MVLLANWLYANEYFETNDREAATSDIKETIGERLGHGVGMVLNHLEEITVVAEVSRGGGKFVLHERTGRTFFDPNDREIHALLEEEISRLIKDLQEQDSKVIGSEDTSDDSTRSVADGEGLGADINEGDLDSTNESAEDDEITDDIPTTLREIAADALDVQMAVEDGLTNPTDHIERMVRFDDVAKAIIDNEEVKRGRSYEPMGWRNAANKWVLTTTAKARKENESLLR